MKSLALTLASREWFDLNNLREVATNIADDCVVSDAFIWGMSKAFKFMDGSLLLISYIGEIVAIEFHGNSMEIMHVSV